MRWLLTIAAWLCAGSVLADQLVRDGVLRSVGSNWTDLGSLTFPFKTIYATSLVGPTNVNGGGGGGSPVIFTNTVTLAAGSNAYCVNFGGMAGVFQLGIPQGATGPAGANGANGATGPAGAPGTNFVTVNQFTNVVLSSQEYLAFSTNYVTWSTSNFLARVPALWTWNIYGGYSGTGPSLGTNIPITLVGSYSGTNGWFTLTNGFSTTNAISVAAIGPGGGQGNANLYYVDHPELIGRTNSFFGQFYQFPNPINGTDAANKSYVDLSIAALSSLWLTFVDASSATHTAFFRNQVTLADFVTRYGWVPITSATVDGTGTNLLLTMNSNTLAGGYQILSGTNLLTAANWGTWTNYTATNVAGVVTLTIPLNLSQPMQFFSAQTGNQSALVLNVPLVLGVASITNSSSSTFGYGAGLLQCDTNYLYVSVATNRWKRAALTTW